MICLWSGKDTSRDKSREHIIPENVGGRQKLPRGYVSDQYNQIFSKFLDRALRFHPAFAASYQIHDHIKGKKRTGMNRQRQGLHPKEYIEKDSFRSIRKKDEIYSINPDYIVKETVFVRALHKCAANILAFEYGVDHVREEYRPLIEFVLTGLNPSDWSYTVCFAHPLFPGFNKEFAILTIIADDKLEPICLILHASGIWGISPKPKGLNYQKILVLSDYIYQSVISSEMKNWLGIKISSSPQCIGSSCFYWCKPNLPVQIYSPFEDNSVFTSCRTCGQILRTGITLAYRLKTQSKEKHGDDKYYRLYLSKSTNSPQIDKVGVVCKTCLCMHIYDHNELFMFEFNKEGTFEI